MQSAGWRAGEGISTQRSVESNNEVHEVVLPEDKTTPTPQKKVWSMSIFCVVLEEGGKMEGIRRKSTEEGRVTSNYCRSEDMRHGCVEGSRGLDLVSSHTKTPLCDTEPKPELNLRVSEAILKVSKGGKLRGDALSNFLEGLLNVIIETKWEFKDYDPCLHSGKLHVGIGCKLCKQRRELCVCIICGNTWESLGWTSNFPEDRSMHMACAACMLD